MNKKALVFLVANLIFCSQFPFGGYHGGNGHGNGGNNGHGNNDTIPDTTIYNGKLLIDNFESGTNRNALGLPWYYYDDAVDGGTSRITNASVDDDGILEFIPSPNIGLRRSNAGQLEYRFGANKPVGCSGECEFGQYVGMGTLFAPEGFFADLRGISRVTFFAKAEQPTPVIVEFATEAVTDYGYHYKLLTIGTDWQQYTIDFSDLVQPTWAVEEVFDYSRVSRIQFKISADNRSTPSAGNFLIDELYLDHASTLENCFLIDDFNDGNQFNTREHPWFYTTDSVDGGTSSITRLQTGGSTILPAYYFGYNNTYGGVLSYVFGPNKPVGCSGECEYGQFVTLSCDVTTSLCDLSNASVLTFKAMADKSMKVTVNFKTTDVVDLGYYCRTLTVSNTWQEYRIPFTDIVQPNWAFEVDFIPGNIVGLDWTITADNSGTPTSGTVTIDDVLFE